MATFIWTGASSTNPNDPMNWDPPGPPGPGQRQDFGRDQAVVQNGVGLRQQARGAHGQQFGISRASANKSNFWCNMI